MKIKFIFAHSHLLETGSKKSKHFHPIGTQENRYGQLGFHNYHLKIS